MAEKDISLAELTRRAAKPDRWDDPLDPNMTDADVDGLLAAMGQQHAALTAAYRQELGAVEGALLQVRARE